MDKRTCKRKIRRLNICFSDGNTECNGISSDFSCNGLFIRTRRGFKEGTTVIMKLEMENGEVLPMRGVVKRLIKTQMAHYKNGMGIELSSIPKEYDNFVEELYKEK